MSIFNSLVLLITLVSLVHCQGGKPNLIRLEFTPTRPLQSGPYDCTVYINDDATLAASAVKDTFVQEIVNILEPISKNIQFLGWRPSVHPAGTLPGGKLIFSNTRKLNTDISDSRNIYDATLDAFNFAVSAGCRRPVLALGPMLSLGADTSTWRGLEYRYLNAVLGAFQGLYTPYDLILAGRMTDGKYDMLTVYGPETETALAKKYASNIEQGRWIARDLCGGDPEVMTPANFVEYVKNNVGDEKLKVVLTDIVDTDYPMIAAVNQASKDIPRFNGKILEITYASTAAAPTTELYMVGEGLTYDVGGLDIRTGGAMEGMSRKKCGAAGIIGFMKTASLLSTVPISIKAKMAVVRNNLGSRGFSADDIILSNGKRVKIGFTQAVGRIMLGELLTDYVKQAAASTADTKHIYTVATMSEHVIKVWKYFTGIMVNGPGAEANMAKNLQDSGEYVSDMGEISDIIKEDFDAIGGPLETEDLRASSPAPSISTTRGHMIPAAYMMKVSGLYDDHGLGTTKPLVYVHLDVSGSAGKHPNRPTGAPVSMLAKQYLINK